MDGIPYGGVSFRDPSIDDLDIQILGSKEGEGPKQPSMEVLKEVKQEKFEDMILKSFPTSRGDEPHNGLGDKGGDATRAPLEIPLKKKNWDSNYCFFLFWAFILYFHVLYKTFKLSETMKWQL